LGSITHLFAAPATVASPPVASCPVAGAPKTEPSRRRPAYAPETQRDLRCSRDAKAAPCTGRPARARGRRRSVSCILMCTIFGMPGTNQASRSRT